MKIAVIWDSDYPWDVRVEKVAKALISSGNEVHLICRNEKMKKVYDKIDSINIHRLGVYVKFSRWLNSFLTFPAFFNPIWLFKIGKVIRDNNIDYVIVRDLPLCPSAIWISKLYKIPCAMDMAECYPELLRCIWKFEQFNVLNILVRNPVLADFVEKYCVKRLDKIFVMIDEARDRLISMGVPSEKVVIVSNTPPLNLLRPKEGSNSKNDELTLLYLGILNPSRGLVEVINGVNELKKRGSYCTLKIAGTGKAENDLKNYTAKLGLTDRISFLGWVDRDSINELFETASIGVVPHHVCSHWNSTIPNKLFDYMAAAIPVLSTNVVPMSRIITEADCGLIYKDLDSCSFADAVEKLSNRELRTQLGINGRVKVDEKFNWSVDSKALIENVRV